ncbi:rho GTPase-activating protein 11A isoform X2 [Patella vulgata]|uniref:rho GTPase-activating protein 11A isoform X2 n=1 Tax=Patella vulgata TaxID=6465 RepID=UPI0021809987|nr:rho GTPase-activating protein 11A isoform X2 [Patella vulgata]
MEGYRNIFTIDHVNRLRQLAEQDLREKGVKLPKSKKTKKLNTSRGPNQDGLMTASNIFGNYLSHVPCVYVSDCGYVPKFLVDAEEVIVNNVNQEGIFRKSGAISRQKELKQQIEEGKCFTDANVNDVTGLIKQFYRELPEPLFTSVYHDTFVRCYQLGNEDTASQAILLLCLLLPSEYLSALRYTMKLLSFIALHSDTNKMDVANLAVVLAPNIMHVNSKSEKMNSTEEKLIQIQTAIVELLIKNAECVGLVSDDLYSRTCKMVEIYGEEDLDASDDNTLEDSKDCRKKEKKRKRSGSFQGFVSSIANGIAKLRRSTDGKEAKTGNITQSSSCSINTTANECSISQNATEHPLTTPVVMRKRKASGEVIPFSATKKKAIILNLPQQTTLGNTPFTPARKMDINATPSAKDMKTPRKKFLFSPGSSKKTVSNPANTSNSSNISTGSIKKPKGKNIFRRLSGSKSDKDSEALSSSTSSNIGERLASPPDSSPQDIVDRIHKQSHLDSPLSGRLPTSPSLPDISVLSQANSLNEGFIMDGAENDFERSEATQDRGRSLQRNAQASSSDPTADKSPKKPSRRSLSADHAMLNKLQNLKRGAPNTITNGLLKGKPCDLKKLRRSFDKSDIGNPIPLVVPTVSENAMTCQQAMEVQNRRNADSASIKSLSGTSIGSSVSQISTNSQQKIMAPPQSDKAYDLDESDTGFSTISGNTVIFVPKGGKPMLVPHHPQYKKIKSSDSTDSLISSVSESSEASSHHVKMERSVSTDSGKGSLLDDTMLTTAHPKSSLDTAFIEESMLVDSSMNHTRVELDESNVSKQPTGQNMAPMKSISSYDLQNAAPKCQVVRSQSMYCTSFNRPAPNIKPNLQISKETHKLLARAGFMSEGKVARSTEDIQVPVKSPTKSFCRDQSSRCSINMGSLVDMKSELDNEEMKQSRSHGLSEVAEETMEVETSEEADVMTECPSAIIKRANTSLPKHDSILNIQQSNCGKVAENVKNLEQSVDSKDKFVSPYRFPNSTTRKRGMSPIRIPTIFAKTDQQAAKFREIALMAKERGALSRGVAKVPISTNLLKSSSTVTDNNSDFEFVKPAERPSTYHTDRSKSDCSVATSSVSETNSSISISTLSTDSYSDFSTISPMSESGESGDEVFSPKTESTQSNNDQLEESSDDATIKTSFKGQQIELSCSLMETINEVCTPQRSALKDCGNVVAKEQNQSKMSELKLPKSDEEIGDYVVLRTAGGLTPRQILRFSQTPKSKCISPNKPVKRLVSPGSPRRHTARQSNKSSPSRKSDGKPVLSSIPQHLQTDVGNI